MLVRGEYCCSCLRVYMCVRAALLFCLHLITNEKRKEAETTIHRVCVCVCVEESARIKKGLKNTLKTRKRRRKAKKKKPESWLSLLFLFYSSYSSLNDASVKEAPRPGNSKRKKGKTRKERKTREENNNSFTRTSKTSCVAAHRAWGSSKCGSFLCVCVWFREP